MVCYFTVALNSLSVDNPIMFHTLMNRVWEDMSEGLRLKYRKDCVISNRSKHIEKFPQGSDIGTVAKGSCLITGGLSDMGL